MSSRSDRLANRAAELLAQKQIAEARVHNAERGLASVKDLPYPASIPEAYQAELQAARDALQQIHKEQQRIIEEQDRHTTDLPHLALVLVLDPYGNRVIERRDPDETGTDETNWYELGAPESDRPMTFDMAIGVTKRNPSGHEFYRLYTQDEVDDLMDLMNI